MKELIFLFLFLQHTQDARYTSQALLSDYSIVNEQKAFADSSLIHLGDAIATNMSTLDFCNARIDSIDAIIGTAIGAEQVQLYATRNLYDSAGVYIRRTLDAEFNACDYYIELLKGYEKEKKRLERIMKRKGIQYWKPYTPPLPDIYEIILPSHHGSSLLQKKCITYTIHTS